MNVFKEMGCSVAKVSAYPRFLKNRKGKVFGYGVLLLFFYFTLAYLIGGVLFMARFGGIGKSLEKNIPDFRLEDGTLWVEEPCYFESGGSYLDIDTSGYFDLQEANEYTRGYQSVIIMDSEKMFLKSNGQVQTAWFTDFGDFRISRDSLKNWIPMIYVSVIIGGILMYIVQVALFFFAILFLALIGLIFNSILKANLTFGQIYLLGVYSRTLPLAIKALLKLFDITVPFFWVINFGISLIYLYLAIKQVKKGSQPQNAYAYSQGGGYGTGDAYGQGNTYGQGGGYGTGDTYSQGNTYGQGSGYGSGNTYGQGSVYDTGESYDQDKN